MEYPSGTAVFTESGFYYLQGKYKFKIITGRVLASWTFPKVTQTSDVAISQYKLASKLGFREGTIIRSMATNKCYLISDKKRRLIVSPDVYDRLDRSKHDAIDVSPDEVALHEEGSEIN